MWLGPQRCYLVVDDEKRPQFEKLAGKDAIFLVKESGGKMVLTNQALP
jgi:hypothetical protein